MTDQQAELPEDPMLMTPDEIEECQDKLGSYWLRHVTKRMTYTLAMQAAELERMRRERDAARDKNLHYGRAEKAEAECEQLRETLREIRDEWPPEDACWELARCVLLESKGKRMIQSSQTVWVYQNSGSAWTFPNAGGPGVAHSVMSNVWTQLPCCPDVIEFPPNGASAVRFTSPLESGA